MTTKILAPVDALGNLVRFAPMPGQRGEITGAKKLIEGLPLGALLADKAYDSMNAKVFALRNTLHRFMLWPPSEPVRACEGQGTRGRFARPLAFLVFDRKRGRYCQPGLRIILVVVLIEQVV